MPYTSSKSVDRFLIESDPPFELFKKTENQRPLFAVRNIDGNTEPASCVACRAEIEEEVFIGVQYTFDSTRYSALCVKCATELKIVGFQSKSSTKKTRTDKSKNENETKKGDEPVGLLKAKKSKAAETTPEQKVSALLVDASTEEDNHIDLGSDSEEELFEFDVAATPWNEDTSSAFTAPPAADPADLRARIDAVENSLTPQTTSETSQLSKADVHDIVSSVLASALNEAMKDVATQIAKVRGELKSELKAEYNKSTSVLQHELREFREVTTDTLSTVGLSLRDLTSKLMAALDDEEETSSHKDSNPSVPTKEVAQTGATTTSPKLRFDDFVRNTVGHNGETTQTVYNALLKHGYIKSATDDAPRVMDELVKLLRQRGFNVTDGRVTVATA